MKQQSNKQANTQATNNNKQQIVEMKNLKGKSEIRIWKDILEGVGEHWDSGIENKFWFERDIKNDKLKGKLRGEIWNWNDILKGEFERGNVKNIWIWKESLKGGFKIARKLEI